MVAVGGDGSDGIATIGGSADGGATSRDHGGGTPLARTIDGATPVAPPLAAPYPSGNISGGTTLPPRCCLPWQHHPLAVSLFGAATQCHPAPASVSRRHPAPSATWRHPAPLGTTRHYLAPPHTNLQRHPSRRPPCHGGGGGATYLKPAPADLKKVNGRLTMFSKLPLKFSLTIITPLRFLLLV